MSLRRVWALLLKELADYFTSPLLYIIAALFLLIIGFLFYSYLATAKDLSILTANQTVVAPLFGNINMLLLFFSPLMAMRSFSEERRQKTLDLLFKSNLKLSELISGKLIALVVVQFFMVMLSLIFPIVLYWGTAFEWGLIFCYYLGIFFILIAYASVGLFASAICDGQILAAIVSFAILLFFTLLQLSVVTIPNQTVSALISYFSPAYHYEGFSYGAIRSYSVIYFVSFSLFFLFLTREVLRVRR